jgi:hypothetical protein
MLFDSNGLLQHPRRVLLLSRRLSAVVLTFALTGSHVGVCAGWIATPEARMACCSDERSCPMHKSGSLDEGSKRIVSQAEADRCCAASEQNESGPPPSHVVFAVSLAVVPTPVPILLPETVTAADSWRTAVPVPATHIAKHLLLSVLLV